MTLYQINVEETAKINAIYWIEAASLTKAKQLVINNFTPQKRLQTSIPNIIGRKPITSESSRKMQPLLEQEQEKTTCIDCGETLPYPHTLCVDCTKLRIAELKGQQV